jgi:hypothetical protein
MEFVLNYQSRRFHNSFQLQWNIKGLFMSLHWTFGLLVEVYFRCLLIFMNRRRQQLKQILHNVL